MNHIEGEYYNTEKIKIVRFFKKIRTMISSASLKEIFQIYSEICRVSGFIYISDETNMRIKEIHRLMDVDHIRDIMSSVINEVIADNNIHECNVCHQEVSFVPLGDYYRANRKKNGFPYWNARFQLESEAKSSCPLCGAIDRERLIITFLEELRAEEDEELKMLEIAPSNTIAAWAHSKTYIDYETADLFMQGVTYQADLQDMNMIEDEAYHIIICSHVLEHVKEDQKAMSELYRMLKKDGVCIVLVPLVISTFCTDTVEDFGQAEEYNWGHFGQNDHARLYCKEDFIRKLQNTGFCVNELGEDYFGEEYYHMHGFDENSMLYVLTKKI